MRTLHWQQLVTVESLLLRLPLESRPLQQRITRLLLPLYLPLGPKSAAAAKQEQQVH